MDKSAVILFAMAALLIPAVIATADIRLQLFATEGEKNSTINAIPMFHETSPKKTPPEIGEIMPL